MPREKTWVIVGNTVTTDAGYMKDERRCNMYYSRARQRSTVVGSERVTQIGESGDQTSQPVSKHRYMNQNCQIKRTDKGRSHLRRNPITSPISLAILPRRTWCIRALRPRRQSLRNTTSLSLSPVDLQLHSTFTIPIRLTTARTVISKVVTVIEEQMMDQRVRKMGMVRKFL